MPVMMPAICPAAELAAGVFFSGALLGPAASELGPAAGLGTLLAKLGSCLASDDWTALHLYQTICTFENYLQQENDRIIV